MDDKRILWRRTGPHTGLIQLNRPDRLNAMDHAAIERLHALLGELGSDPELRAVVLTGAGRAFSAGADLKELESTPQSEVTVRVARGRLELYQDITRRMVASPIVFLAAMNGVAVGVGAELAIASDIRIGTDATEVILSEVTRGLFETNGVMHYLPRIVGQGRAAQWLLTGERIRSPALLAAGFLTELVPAEQLLARAQALADTIAGNAPISVRLIKQLLRRTWEVDLETMLRYEVDGMLACMASDDIQEGLRAFVERRAPVWQGK